MLIGLLLNRAPAYTRMASQQVLYELFPNTGRYLSSLSFFIEDSNCFGDRNTGESEEPSDCLLHVSVEGDGLSPARVISMLPLRLCAARPTLGLPEFRPDAGRSPGSVVALHFVPLAILLASFAPSQCHSQLRLLVKQVLKTARGVPLQLPLVLVGNCT